MVKIKKIKTDGIYDTYVAIQGGEGTYISRIGFSAPVTANIDGIVKTVLSVLGLGSRYKIV